MRAVIALRLLVHLHCVVVVSPDFLGIDEHRVCVGVHTWRVQAGWSLIDLLRFRVQTSIHSRSSEEFAGKSDHFVLITEIEF